MKNQGLFLMDLSPIRRATSSEELGLAAERVFVSINLDRSIGRRAVREMANPAIESLVESIKSKVRALKKKTKGGAGAGTSKPYMKMAKSSSVKVEIRRRKARKLIDKTLKAADNPGKRSIS
ncbi:hypothetical protein SAY87_017752 [Trapa incisa]|uniref:Uncharacterized protein n=1 Tax=Trapa incisa TaxID=236973 RepID=A0AAN7L9I5_9MYRT|nr:hypothetical protein SAY87_017752 [Trapa incisa]